MNVCMKISLTAVCSIMMQKKIKGLEVKLRNRICDIYLEVIVLGSYISWYDTLIEW